MMRSPSPLYEVISRTNQRENNEDSFQVFTLTPRSDRPSISILAVADGMGGHAHGEEASEQTLRKFSLSLFESLTLETSINSLPEKTRAIDSEKLCQCLREGLKAANEHIGRIVKNNNWGTAGSTVVVAAILENTASVINLGDSPLFHYQASNKRLVQITEDHTIAGVLQRAGMITPEMARVHEGRSRLQFYVGCPELPQDLPVYRVNLEQDDLLLLCSDGVNGSLLLKDIANILASKKTLKQKAEALVKKALDRKETDNQTLILWSHQYYLNPELGSERSNNKIAPDLEKPTQPESKSPNFLQLFLLPLIFIAALAFGSYSFSFFLSLKDRESPTTPVVTRDDRSEVEENNPTPPAPEKIAVEDNIIKNRPAPDYYSCDRIPQNPDRFSKNSSYRLYVKYGEGIRLSQNEAAKEFPTIDGILANLCPPHTEIDGYTWKRFQEIGKEKMFETWFAERERLHSVKQKIKAEEKQQGIQFYVEIIEPESSRTQKR